MKFKLVISCCLMMMVSPLHAKEEGVYMSIADYKSGKLSFVTNCKGSSHGIRLHDFWGASPVLTVKANGQKHTLKKGDVYGYRDCNDHVYRFYKNIAYRILDTGGIYVYVTERNVTQQKGFRVVYDYYFSSTASGSIERLNIENLEAAFKANEKFVELLEYRVADVLSYDKRHGMYTINYLYLLSLK